MPGTIRRHSLKVRRFHEALFLHQPPRPLILPAPEGVPMNCKSVEAIERGLWHAGHKRFGSWSNALRAAGYDPQPIGHR
jgi:hypothetical protein